VLEDLSALEAEEIELRENLDRGELTAGEVDLHLTRLKWIGEEKHKLPPAGRNTVNSSASRDAGRKENSSKSARSHTAVAAGSQTNFGSASVRDSVQSLAWRN
jgi:hypothetical protein